MTFWGADAEVAQWVSAKLGYDLDFDGCRSLGVSRNGEIAAGVVFHDFAPARGTIELTIYSEPGALNRTVAAEVFGYVFRVARMATALTGAGNKRMRRIWRALGGTETEINGLYSANEAGIFLTLTESQWLSSAIRGKA